MKIAIIDCFAGISGDMTLGALIDWGVPVEYIENELRKTGLTDFVIKTEKVLKHTISGVKATVEFDPAKQPERKYQSITKMISDSDFKQEIKEKSFKAFKILGEAESKIHEKSIENIYFHEVGAVDSIVDLVGSIIGFDYLGVEKIYGMPVPLGTGFNWTALGIMPVPSPAALSILKNYPVVHKNSDFEMTTPTGATLFKILVDEILPESIKYLPEKVSYGAGTKNTEKWPNLLRLITAIEVNR